MTVASLDTGDLVLFNRPCHRFSLFGAAVCLATKTLHNTTWDHIGIVVRDGSGRLLLLEASFSGVVARDLHERLDRSTANAIAIRRLQSPHRDDATFQAEARAFLAEMTNRPYKASFWELLSAAVDFHPTKADRRRVAAALDTADSAVASAERDLALSLRDSYGGPLQGRWLEGELASALAAREVLLARAAASERSVFENTADRDGAQSFFCSELVAALYQRLGLLPLFPPPSEYLPCDFASTPKAHLRLRLLDGAQLAPEQWLRGAVSSGKPSTAASGATAANISEGEGQAEERLSRRLQRQSTRVPLAGAAAVEHALHRHRLYSALAPDDRWRFAERFQRVELRPGDCLSAADASSGLSVVETGELEVMLSGKTPAAVATLGEGNCFGSGERIGGGNAGDLEGASALGESSRGGEEIALSMPEFENAHAAVPRRRGWRMLWPFGTRADAQPSPEPQLPPSQAPSSPPEAASGSTRWRLVAKSPVVLWRATPADVGAAAAEAAAAGGGQAAGLVMRRRLAGLLARHPAFSMLGPAQRRALEEAFFPVRFAAGEMVVREGAYGDDFYVLHRGTARIVMSREAAGIPTSAAAAASSGGGGGSGATAGDAEDRVTVATLSPGACFGDEALLHGAPRSASVVCEEDCDFYALDRATFSKATLIAGSPTLRRFFEAHASVKLPQGGGKLMTANDLFLATGQPAEGTQGGKRVLKAIASGATGLVSFADLARLESWLKTPRAEHHAAFRLAGIDPSFHGVPVAAYDRLVAQAREALGEEGSTGGQDPENETLAEVRFRRMLFGLRGRRIASYERFVRELDDEVLCPPLLARYLRLLRADLEAFRSSAAAATHGRVLSETAAPNNNAADDEEAVTHRRTLSGPTAGWWHGLAAAAAGGGAGRCLVAPLERLKMLQQVDEVYRRRGVVGGLRLMLEEDGWRGLFRGNGLNMMRVAPVLAMQVALYAPLQAALEMVWRRRLVAYDASMPDGAVAATGGELTERSRLSAVPGVRLSEASQADTATAAASAAAAFAPGDVPLEIKHLLVGGTAGVLANVVANPVEVVRSRFTVQRQQAQTSVAAVLRAANAAGGPAFLLTRGLGASASWAFIYIGLNYVGLAALAPLYVTTTSAPGGSGGGGGGGGGGANEAEEGLEILRPHFWAITCGIAAGWLAQTAAFPFDVVRRRMHVQTPHTTPFFRGTWRALRSIAAAEGVSGLYRGIGPMLLKFPPSFAASYGVSLALSRLLSPSADKTTSKSSVQ